jgi:hypothetical protein
MLPAQKLVHISSPLRNNKHVLTLEDTEDASASITQLVYHLPRLLGVARGDSHKVANHLTT